MERKVTENDFQYRNSQGAYIQVLTERGKYNKSMKLEDMRKEISTHPDFMNKKTKLEHFLHDCGHICITLLKFKIYKEFYKLLIATIRINIPNGLVSVLLDNIQNYFCKVRQYMFGYLEGFTAGPHLEKIIKKHKKAYKSRRKISTNE